MNRTDITSLLVVSNKGIGVVNGYQNVNYITFTDYPIVKSFLDSKAKSKWFDTHEQTIGSLRGVTESGRNIGLVKNIYSDTSLKSHGFIMFFIREAAVNDLIKDITLPNNGIMYIIGEDDNIVLDPLNMENNGLKLSSLNKDTEKNKYITDEFYKNLQIDSWGIFNEAINRKNMLITYHKIPSIKGTPLNWSIVSMTEVSKVTESVNQAGLLVILMGIIFLILSLITSFLITRDITKSIKSLIKVTDQVREGNLNIELKHDREDEIGYLENSFGLMISSLKDLIGSIKNASTISVNSSQTVSASCGENYASIQELSSIIETVKTESNRQIENVLIGKEEVVTISQKINIANDNIKVADEIISKSKELSNNNKSSVQLLYCMSNNIKSAMTQIGTEINDLIEASSQITKITKAIKNISSQTNLLALNAAIEAARAGAHGKSFSLVAEEVNKLSLQSKEFAADIDNKLKNITNKIEETKLSVDSLKQVVQDSESSIEDIIGNFDNNVDFLNSIISQIVNIRNSVLSIENSKKGIMNAVENISSSSESNMQYIDSMTHSTREQLTMIKQLVQNAEKLMLLSYDLESTTNKFKA